jgi:hypothetical protein
LLVSFFIQHHLLEPVAFGQALGQMLDQIAYGCPFRQGNILVDLPELRSKGPEKFDLHLDHVPSLNPIARRVARVSRLHRSIVVVIRQVIK